MTLQRIFWHQKVLRGRNCTLLPLNTEKNTISCALQTFVSTEEVAEQEVAATTAAMDAVAMDAAGMDLAAMDVAAMDAEAMDAAAAAMDAV